MLTAEERARGQRLGAVLRQARGEILPDDEDQSETPAEKVRATVGASNGEKKSRRRREAPSAEPAAAQAGDTSTITVLPLAEMLAADSSGTETDRGATAI